MSERTQLLGSSTVSGHKLSSKTGNSGRLPSKVPSTKTSIKYSNVKFAVNFFLANYNGDNVVNVQITLPMSKEETPPSQPIKKVHVPYQQIRLEKAEIALFPDVVKEITKLKPGESKKISYDLSSPSFFSSTAMTTMQKVLAIYKLRGENIEKERELLQNIDPATYMEPSTMLGGRRHRKHKTMKKK